jgi:hypothetical protein
VWYIPISDDPGGNRIYARLGAEAHFRTEELTEIDRVNGVEFKAVSYLLIARRSKLGTFYSLDRLEAEP